MSAVSELPGPEALLGEITRIRSNIQSYYDSASQHLEWNYNIFKSLNLATIFLAIGIILCSGYAALNLNFFDRGASIIATLCGLLITACQVVWSRSGYSQHSSTYRAICIECHAARNQISQKLLMISNGDPQAQPKLQKLLDQAVDREAKIHSMQLTLTSVPERIEGLDSTGQGAPFKKEAK